MCNRISICRSASFCGDTGIGWICQGCQKIPKRAFQVIEKHREEAIPYLHEAIDRVIVEKDDLEEDYQLHFYASFLLGEFQDKRAFERIAALDCLPSEALDYLIGDAVTEGLSDVLYNTYNGNMELLKQSVRI